MIKGVNRQIIEVNATHNVYFERALLVVRPNCEHLGCKRLQTEADRFVLNLDGYSGLKRNRRRHRLVQTVYAVGGAALGLAVGFFCR